MPAPVPTDRELEALKILWQRGEATVREIWQAMTAAEDDLAYTTILSLLQVMEQKGLVGHQRVGKAYVYVASIRKAETFRKLARGFLDKVFDGAVDEYLVHVLESRRISAEELSKLETLITDARARADQTKKRSSPKC